MQTNLASWLPAALAAAAVLIAWGALGTRVDALERSHVSFEIAVERLADIRAEMAEVRTDIGWIKVELSKKK